MVKHIVMWSFKEEVAREERPAAAAKIKEGLEGLVGTVPGLISARVVEKPLSSSSHDLALVAEFESAQALKEYSTHPAHVHVAGTFVRPITCNRSCLDYEE